MRFTAWKADQTLQGTELQLKEVDKGKKHIGKLIRKNPKIKISVNSGLQVIICRPAGKEFQGLAVRGNKLLT